MEEPVDEKPEVQYSFFVAGHVYGNPITFGAGLHPPFVEMIPTINEMPKMVLGVFTGDVVPHSTPEYWDAAEETFSQLSMPFVIAPGNHDRNQEFLNRFHTNYQSFTIQNDLFIVLSPKSSSWHIDSEQLTFVEETLETFGGDAERIFVFFHELMWWTPENQFGDVVINYLGNYPGPSNFYDDVLPLFEDYDVPVTWFAGDLGASKNVSAVMYHEQENHTYIASGMGGGEQDNIVIVEVLWDGTVRMNLYAINGDDPTALGTLQDHTFL